MKIRDLIAAHTGYTGDDPSEARRAVLRSAGISDAAADKWAEARAPLDLDAELRAEVKPPVAETAEDGTLDIPITGPIVDKGLATFLRAVFDEECVAACEVKAMLANADPKGRVRLRIASPGGLVSQMSPIVSYLAEYRAKGGTVDTVADGMAASAAASLFLTGEKREMAEYAELMFHRAWAGMVVVGNATDIETATKGLVDSLNTFDQTLKAAVAARSSLTEEQVWEKIEKTDWFLSRAIAMELGVSTGEAFAAKPDEDKPEAEARAEVADTYRAGRAMRVLTGLALDGV